MVVKTTIGCDIYGKGVFDGPPCDGLKNFFEPGSGQMPGGGVEKCASGTLNEIRGVGCLGRREEREQAEEKSRPTSIGDF